MPSRLSDILSHQQAIDWLRSAWQSERLPHGLIFAGPVGVGKATTARALGALFLCEKPSPDDACGRCASCRAIDSNSHPDLRIITKELIRYHDRTGKSKGIDLSINVIRPELIDAAARTPAMGRGKVFIIEQAELMNPQAQNAMLKTLEEPSGRALVILLTAEPNALLATIRSRCQLVRFESLEQELVQAELAERGIGTKEASAAAVFADGSLGVALRWLEDGVIERARELIDQLEIIESGKPAEDLVDWFRKSAETYAEKQLTRDALSSKDQATREGLSVYLWIASNHFRNRLRELEEPDEIERMCGAIDAVVRAEQYLDANVNVTLVLHQLANALERSARRMVSA